MATKLYFHAALNSLSNLPTTEQSSLTPDANLFTGEDGSANRLMDTTIGTSQASLTNQSTNDTNAHNYYVARWVSPPLNVSSIAANTWDYNFAALEGNTSANFPVGSTAAAVRVNCYVWRPSNQTKVGTILDGNSAADFAEPSAANTEKVMNGTFSGSAVSSISQGDVLVFEMWFVVTQAMGTAYTQTVYFDGTTENTTDNATVSNHASFINTPETITFLVTKFVTADETLDLTDTNAVFRKRFVSSDETLDLTDTNSVFKKRPVSVSESLDLDETNAVKKTAVLSLDESLDLTDTAAVFKTALITIAETLDLVDTNNVFATSGGETKFVSVAETLDLTDDRATFKQAIISIAEALDLTDDRATFKEAIIAIAESLDLTDTNNVARQAMISVVESLDLVDTQTTFKQALISIAESLDLVDTVNVFKSGAPETKFVSVTETLDLVDAAAVAAQGPSAEYRGGGRFIEVQRIVRRITEPLARPQFIYYISLNESLNLVDNIKTELKPGIISQLARIQKTNPELIPVYHEQQNNESLDMVDTVEVKVIRRGRAQILQNIESALDTLEKIEELESQSEAIGIGQDIKINLTKTNRLQKEIYDNLIADLKKELKKIIADFDDVTIPTSDELIRQKHEARIYALIRTAVESSYELGANYVGRVLKEDSIFTTQSDINKIKSETERIVGQFWRSLFEKLRQYQLNKSMSAPPPIAFLGLGLGQDIEEEELTPREKLDNSLENTLNLLAGIATIGIVAKATQSKLNQLPNETPTEKRVLVYQTEQDAKVCQICRRYQDVEYFEDDPFIVRPIEDTHLRCRCRLLLKGPNGELISG